MQPPPSTLSYMSNARIIAAQNMTPGWIFIATRHCFLLICHHYESQLKQLFSSTILINNLHQSQLCRSRHSSPCQSRADQSVMKFLITSKICQFKKNLLHSEKFNIFNIKNSYLKIIQDFFFLKKILRCNIAC